MKGNQCYFGHINLPEDPKKFNIHAMANKKGELKNAVNARKAIHLTMVTSFGVRPNAYANNVQSFVTLEDLFG